MDRATLNTYIQNAIKANGNKEITGPVLQNVLLNLLDSSILQGEGISDPGEAKIIQPGDLTNGKYTFSHNLNSEIVRISAIIDHLGMYLSPANVQLKKIDANNIEIDFYGTIPGNYIVLIEKPNYSLYVPPSPNIIFNETFDSLQDIELCKIPSGWFLFPEHYDGTDPFKIVNQESNKWYMHKENYEPDFNNIVGIYRPIGDIPASKSLKVTIDVEDHEMFSQNADRLIIKHRKKSTSEWDHGLIEFIEGPGNIEMVYSYGYETDAFAIYINDNMRVYINSIKLEHL